jgi:hypothetical protein
VSRIVDTQSVTDPVAVRVVASGGARKREVVARPGTLRETVLASEFMTAKRHGSDRMTARRAALQLFTRRPNEVVSREDIEAVVGRSLSSSATVSEAVASLARDMPIVTVTRCAAQGRPSGWVYLLATPSCGDRRCATCAKNTLAGICLRTKGRARLDDVCWGWTA